jgi:hypothetical protein
VWAASDGRPLAQVCEQVGAAWQMAADAVLHHVLAVLPQLLESGAAFLDLAPRGNAR